MAELCTALLVEVGGKTVIHSGDAPRVDFQLFLNRIPTPFHNKLPMSLSNPAHCLPEHDMKCSRRANSTMHNGFAVLHLRIFPMIRECYKRLLRFDWVSLVSFWILDMMRSSLDQQ
jgi:hypothetical protein